MSSTLRELQRRKSTFFVIHSNQHYNKTMDRIFFEELELAPAKYNLNIGSGSHGEQTSVMIKKIETILLKEKPDVVYVEGDTNTVLAGALAASKLRIKVAHVEAGLRSYDRTMPEELNRIVTDHISNYLFAPTQEAVRTLKREGIDRKTIFMVGNTIADAVQQSLPLAEKRYDFLKTIGVASSRYALLTLHRPANVDDKTALQNILIGIERSATILRVPVIFPIHPRTKERLSAHALALPKCITAIDPCGFLDMLLLEQHSSMIFTDSGGIQEEACILQKKCVTIRENTERPETIKVGGNILGGVTTGTIARATSTLVARSVVWHNPFGDGTTGKRLINITEHTDIA